jgi:hypothetical protein
MVGSGAEMKANIIASAIIALGLIVAGFLLGGRYYFFDLGKCVVARGDRWTGEIKTISGDCDFKF